MRVGTPVLCDTSPILMVTTFSLTSVSRIVADVTASELDLPFM
jgi:hypothetical protein